jgi:hypothetical protein
LRTFDFFRVTKPAALAASLVLLSACGSTQSFPEIAQQNSILPAADVRASFPGSHAMGVAAHYVVFTRPYGRFFVAMDAVQVQEIPSYKAAFGSTVAPLPGAIVVYPDASRQTADKTGAFDAGISSYAKAHPESIDGTDAIIVIHSPTSFGTKSVAFAIFAPPEAQEKKIESGVTATKPATSQRRSGGASVWSCDPADYIAKTEYFVTSNELAATGFIAGDGSVSYEAKYDTCGTNSPSTRIAWSSTRWAHLGSSFGVKTRTRWSIRFIPLAFNGSQVALWAQPSSAKAAEQRLVLLGQ